jgi:hypothetical protein
MFNSNRIKTLLQRLHDTDFGDVNPLLLHPWTENELLSIFSVKTSITEGREYIAAAIASIHKDEIALYELNLSRFHLRIITLKRWLCNLFGHSTWDEVRLRRLCHTLQFLEAVLCLDDADGAGSGVGFGEEELRLRQVYPALIPLAELFDSFHARLSESLREEEEGEEREDEAEGRESDGDEAEPCQNQCIGVMEVEGGLGSLMVDGEVNGVETENGGDDAVADME